MVCGVWKGYSDVDSVCVITVMWPGGCDDYNAVYVTVMAMHVCVVMTHVEQLRHGCDGCGGLCGCNGCNDIVSSDCDGKCVRKCV